MFVIFILLLVITFIIYLFIKKYKFIKSNIPKNIYMFWDKGWDKAPYICQECLLSWKYYNPNWKIITLDKKNIYNYLSKELLDDIWEKKLVQHQADIIRVNLLKKYGGVWTDSTIFCNKSLDDWLYR